MKVRAMRWRKSGSSGRASAYWIRLYRRNTVQERSTRMDWLPQKQDAEKKFSEALITGWA